jgi:transposase-like protein
MDKREELIRLIKILPQDRLDEIIDSVKNIINEIDKDDINMGNVTRKRNDNEIVSKDSNVDISKEAENADKKKVVEEMLVQSNRPPCPRCGCESVVRNGKKHGNQRYRCNKCESTYTGTYDTIAHRSKLSEDEWKKVIKDTIDGKSLDQTAAELGVTHKTAFNMRHKILMAVEHCDSIDPISLEGSCELDETYVLESLKGTKIPEDYWRGPRKHGAKAASRGMSSEQVCICTGIARGGRAYAKTVNLANPSADEIGIAFDGRISSHSHLICDGSKSYNKLAQNTSSTIAHVKGGYSDSESDDNLNTVNNFHGFIKGRYLIGYRGVATKYLNRYNALFARSYRYKDKTVDMIYKMLKPGTAKAYHSCAEVKNDHLIKILDTGY